MDEDDVISLQDYLDVLLRQRWLVVTVTAVVTIAALGTTTSLPSTYEAETHVVALPTDRIQGQTDQIVLQYSDNPVQNERLVLTSRSVGSQVAAQLGIDDVGELLDERLEVETVEEARLLRVVVTDETASRAAQTADAFGEVYLDQRRDEITEHVLATRSNLEDQAARVLEELEDVESGVVASDGAGILDAEDHRVDARREALLRELLEIRSRLENLDVLLDTLPEAGAISIRAEVPASPVSPRPIRTGSLALILGLLLGVGGAFLRDHWDDTLHDERTVLRATGGRPILGRIPRWEVEAKGTEVPRVDTDRHVSIEPYRELLANVRFLLRSSERPGGSGHEGEERPSNTHAPTQQPDGRVVLVTAAQGGAGSSTTAANLAIASAQFGTRTLLIDADLHTGKASRTFGAPAGHGLSAVLAGSSIASESHHTPQENLTVLGCGPSHSNVSELLDAGNLVALLGELRSEAGLVVVDSPAVLQVADALSIGAEVDLTLLVVSAEASDARTVSSAVTRLEQAGATVDGSVINAIARRRYTAFNYFPGTGSRAPGEAEAAPGSQPDIPRDGDEGSSRPDHVRARTR